MNTTLANRGEIEMKSLKVTNIKWAILDENKQYVHGHSIKKIGKDKYTYVNYPKVEIRYTSKERVNQAIECLNLHNVIGKLGHIFTIVEIHALI